jgi:hypothetical protein
MDRMQVGGYRAMNREERIRGGGYKRIDRGIYCIRYSKYRGDEDTEENNGRGIQGADIRWEKTEGG